MKKSTACRLGMTGGMLVLAGCATPGTMIAPPVAASRQSVTAIELEYVDRFLVPAAAYSLLPRCPQPDRAACSDAALVASLRLKQKKLHDTIIALRNFSDASPQANATALIANARRELAEGEAMVPRKPGARGLP